MSNREGGSYPPSALAGFLLVSPRQLSGRRAFTVVSIPADKVDACNEDDLIGCAENSAIRMSLTFSPA